MLVQQIGWIAIAGVSLSITCEVLHYHLANYNIKFYKEVSKMKDERITVLA